MSVDSGSSSSRYDGLYKVLLVGDAAAGKTSLSRAFVGEEPFSQDYLPTIVIDFKVKLVDLPREPLDGHRDKERKIKLQIW